MQNPGGDETSTLSAGSQEVRVTIRMPALLTFSVGTTSKTPGLWRLVSHKGALKWERGSDLGLLALVPNNKAALGSTVSETAAFSASSESNARGESKLQLTAAGRKLERPPAAFPRISGAAFWLLCSSLSEESGRGSHWSSCRRGE